MTVHAFAELAFNLQIESSAHFRRLSWRQWVPDCHSSLPRPYALHSVETVPFISCSPFEIILQMLSFDIRYPLQSIVPDVTLG